MHEYSTKHDRVPTALRKQILERDGYRCVICELHSPDRLGLLHIDHKHPKSKGGPTIPSNLRTLCGDCNMKRRNNTPTCPNCGDWVVEDKAFCPTCSFALQPIVTSVEKKPPSINPQARKFLLGVAGFLIVVGLGLLALTVASSVWSKMSGSGTRLVSGAANYCTVADGSGRANLKTKCDSIDCDNDPATVAGKISSGTSVSRTGNVIRSGLPSVGEWIEITYNGQTYFVASTRLSCP